MPEKKKQTPQKFLRHLMSDLVTKQTLNGKEYWAVPAVLLTEGVHNGVFYPAEELAKFPQSWNGRPVVVQHPKDLAGKAISASSPELMERMTVGVIYNTRFDKKLKADLWIDPEKTKMVDSSIIASLQGNRPIEVSTGLFTEDVFLEEEQEWNGEKYRTVSLNYRPDHLALLPGLQGACSWEDGCGSPRINEKLEEDEKGIKSLFRKLVELAGLKPAQNQDNIDEDEKQKNLSEKELKNKRTETTMKDKKKRVDALIGCEKCVWEEKDRKFLTALEDDQLGKVEEGVKSKEPEEKNSQETTKQQEEKKVADEKKEETSSVSEMAKKVYEKAIAGEKQEEEKQEEKPITVDEYIEKAPAEVKEILSDGVRTHRAQKAQVIEDLLENTRNKFTKEQLEVKTLDELCKLAFLAKVTVDFSAQGDALKEQEEEVEEEVPEMPKMNWDKK